MTACNAHPPDGHPWHGSGVACHFAAGHDGPHAWDPERAEHDRDRLRLIEEVVTTVVDFDLPDLDLERRRELALHLTGAMFVATREGGTTLLRQWLEEPACGMVEPNASAANAAVCDRPAGHDGWHEGPARGPAAGERPGRHRWAEVTR